VTLAGAVLVSGFAALTLTLMMCSLLLRHETRHSRIYNWIEAGFVSFTSGCRRLLLASLRMRWVGDVGVNADTVGRTLETMLGGRQVTRFKRDGGQYDVMVQVAPLDRTTPADISEIYVRGRDGVRVQLANLVQVREGVAPQSLNFFQRLRAVGDRWRPRFRHAADPVRGTGRLHLVRAPRAHRPCPDHASRSREGVDRRPGWAAPRPDGAVRAVDEPGPSPAFVRPIAASWW
jgi:hypothetical protein